MLMSNQEQMPEKLVALCSQWPKGLQKCLDNAARISYMKSELPKLKELIDQDIESANEQMEGFEKIRKYTIVCERFTENNGRLTPTQKTKKNEILKDYEDVIEKMY
jgi:long-subunit acyl-CoA synthetase (AMP-forming)